MAILEIYPSCLLSLFHKGAVTHLSEQISTLNDRMDDFTSKMEELNSKLTKKRTSQSTQSLALQAEACNGSGPTSYFISGLGNGSLTGSIMPNSSSSSLLIPKESNLMEEVHISPCFRHADLCLINHLRLLLFL